MRRILRFGHGLASPTQHKCGYPISAHSGRYLEKGGRVRTTGDGTEVSHDTAKYLPLWLNAIIPIRTLGPGTAAA